MHGKTKGGPSVLSKEIFGEPEQQNQVMICYRGLLWPTKAVVPETRMHGQANAHGAVTKKAGQPARCDVQ